ncbi:MAG: MBL fold metallo-hydrolase [Oscillospiraceae bacterium]|nr:MBL fold metallo-hydrolase [Oscillospiraceae bacterium]
MQKELIFFGRGGAFSKSKNYNSAYFETDDSFVIIDCPMTTTEKLLEMDLNNKKPYILVTHTHSDHIGGIGMLAFACKFRKNIKINLVVPSQEILDNLKTYLKIEGVKEELYNICRADELDKEFLVKAIKTDHVEDFDSFGYQLNVNGVNVIYTGDTNTLEPFLPYLSEGSRLYTEIATNKNLVHLYFEDAKETIEELVKNGVKVYFMHLADEEEARKLAKSINDGRGVELAPLISDGKKIIMSRK